MRKASVSGGGCVGSDCPLAALVRAPVMQAQKGEVVNSGRKDGCRPESNPS